MRPYLHVASVTTSSSSRLPKNPIVLCHGLFGFDTIGNIVNYWTDIPSALKAAGAEVWVARVPATSSVETRARVLVQSIAQKYHGRSVHLIGHSMGGLDCRYLTTHLLDGAGFSVSSVTTIATPHWGTPAADLLAATRIAETPVVRALMNIFPAGDGDGQAFVSLSTGAARDFNGRTPDRSGVRYYSYGCSFIPGVLDVLTWGPTYLHIQAVEGENDGVVSVRSARWGEYVGTIQGVNHIEVIGHKLPQIRLTDVFDLVSGKAPFDPKKKMIDHAKKLSNEVETG